MFTTTQRNEHNASRYIRISTTMQIDLNTNVKNHPKYDKIFIQFFFYLASSQPLSFIIICIYTSRLLFCFLSYIKIKKKMLEVWWSQLLLQVHSTFFFFSLQERIICDFYASSSHGLRGGSCSTFFLSYFFFSSGTFLF